MGELYMKKIISIFSVLIFSVVLAACSNGETTKNVEQKKVYKTKIEKISQDHGDWIVSGKTTAPNNTKIIVMPVDSENMYFGENLGTTDDSMGFSKVHQGKFKVFISGIFMRKGDDYTVGETVKVFIGAISNYKTSHVESSLPKKVVSDLQNKLPEVKLTYNQAQVNYLNNVGNDSSDDNESSSDSTEASSSESESSVYDSAEGESNAQNYGYGDFIKSDKWVGQSFHISKAQVLQANEEENGTMLLVYTDDDPSNLYMVLSKETTDAVKDDFVDVQGIFSKRETYETNIGGKNTTPVLIANKITVTGKADY